MSKHNAKLIKIGRKGIEGITVLNFLGTNISVTVAMK